MTQSATKTSASPVAIPDASRPASSTKPPRLVFVRDLELVASVGVYEVEQRYEQRIVIGLELEVTDTYDGISERLADVLDYSVIVHDVEVLCQSRHFKLIETLAEAIAGICLRDARVLVVRVRVEKPDIMPACRTVGVEITRQRR